MRIPKELFNLQRVVDNPLFEGFALEKGPSVLGREDIDEDLINDFDAKNHELDWKPALLVNVWKCPKVLGRVRPFNDFPCLNMTEPTFSKRACKILKDFLEPNGELLPLQSDIGEYYFYNITSVVRDALDMKESVYQLWREAPSTALEIDYFSLYEERLKVPPIFRFAEYPQGAIVTDEFVKRVRDYGLNGFEFQKIWPLPRGENWRMQHKKTMKAVETDQKELKQNTLVIILPFAGKKPDAAEKKQFKKLEDELDAQFVVQSLNQTYFGSYEGHDLVGSEYRMFLSCPDVDSLVRKLLPWLEGFEWSTKVHVMKRYSNLHDKDAEEKLVELKRKL